MEDLQSRIAEVERQMQARMSPEQRNALYRLVQTYGEARAARRGTGQPGPEIRTCWTEFNACFSIATYTDLPVSRFDVVILFVKNQYHTLTGEDIETGTQESLL